MFVIRFIFIFHLVYICLKVRGLALSHISDSLIPLLLWKARRSSHIASQATIYYRYYIISTLLYYRYCKFTLECAFVLVYVSYQLIFYQSGGSSAAQSDILVLGVMARRLNHFPVLELMKKNLNLFSIYFIYFRDLT